jgi:hypothetical protein
MKTLKPISIALLVLTGTLLAARGEDFRTDINPALLYYRAMLATPAYLSDADQKYPESLWWKPGGVCAGTMAIASFSPGYAPSCSTATATASRRLNPALS